MNVTNSTLYSTNNVKSIKQHSQPYVTITVYSSLLTHHERIRYNNLLIIGSSIRKLFVYISSAIANTQVFSLTPCQQFDIQALSQKLASFPPTDSYSFIKEELVLQDLFTDILSIVLIIIKEKYSTVRDQFPFKSAVPQDHQKSSHDVVQKNIPFLKYTLMSGTNL